MKVSVLERMLVVERHRRRMGDLGVFAPPIATRFASTPDDGPWVTSLSTGRFSLTRLDREGSVGQAFTECSPDEEDPWLGELYRTLWTLSSKFGWSNRCGSIAEAVRCLTSFGFEPKTLAIPYSTLKDVVGEELSEEEADRVTMSKGCVAEIDGVRVLSARTALPAGSALLATAAPLVGQYTRVHERVAATLFRADRAWVLVGDVA